MKKAMERIGVWICEAGIAGAPMIPLFIYVTSFIAHEGQFAYVLPFVLFYAFNKTGEYALGVFGPVKNPYRIAVAACWTVIAGASLSLLGEVSVAFLDLGAVLVGFGTSVFAPIWRTLRSGLQKEGRYPYGHSERVGFLLMTVFSGLILLAQGHLEEAIIACYVATSVITLFVLRLLCAHEKGPLFDYSQRDLKKAVPALALLAIVFFVRLFKQTADGADILAVLVLVTAVMVVVAAKSFLATREVFEYRSLFYGQCLIYMILFDVFWFIGSGNIQAVLIANLVQFAAQFTGMTWGKRLLGLFPARWRQSEVLVACDMAVLLLFLAPPLPLNFLSIFLVALIGGLGNARVGALYRKHRQWSDLDYTIVSQKVMGLGIVAGQAVLVGVLALVSWIMEGNTSTLMAAYALRAGSNGLAGPFLVTKLVCTGVFLLEGAAVLWATYKKSGTVFVDRPGGQAR